MGRKDSQQTARPSHSGGMPIFGMNAHSLSALCNCNNSKQTHDCTAIIQNKRTVVESQCQSK